MTWIARTLLGALAFVPMLSMAQHDVAATHASSAIVGTETILARPITVSLDHIGLLGAIDALAAAGGVTVAYQHDVVAAAAKGTVTVRFVRVPLSDAFARVLSDVPLQLVSILGGQLSIVSADIPKSFIGGIAGHVVDAKTKMPVRGATVLVDGATRGVVADEQGMFRIDGVSAGEHRVTVRLLGYVRQIKTISVVDGQTVDLTMALEASANTLDQVVVTGTVIPTELKAVPNAITVITAKQIEERGITRIDQLFRGDIPGIFTPNRGSGNALDVVTMFSRGGTSLTFDASQNPIKTYVDGVELADPKYLSQIDPQSIERIEILTGPQASTIYGSNAINGVMQIFTKRGTTSRPQVTLNLLSGWVQNNLNSALTPQHDYSAQLRGIENRMAYNVGGSWNYIGAWTPAKQTARTNVFGGVRLELPIAFGMVTTDVTLRRSGTQNRQRGAVDQVFTGYMETGWNQVGSTDGLSNPTTYTLVGQTLGFTVHYTPTDWWSHEVGVGQDASDNEMRYTAVAYRRPNDTTLTLTQNHTDRRSLRYTTTARVPVTSLAQLTVTTGVDGWQNLATYMYVSPQSLAGTLSGPTYLTRQPGHNTGGFMQAQLGVSNQLFLTYGLRAEWNPNYGEAAQPNYAPRYGLAYTTDVGPITTKLRASYGRSTRPPSADEKRSVPERGSDEILFYGPHNSRIANPRLGPEYQQGGEGGLELYLGTRGSLVITHYSQTVDALIAEIPGADSIRSLQPNPMVFGLTCTQLILFNDPTDCSSQDSAGYGYALLSQNLNTASIRNQGWELQGSAVMGPITAKGTYSWTKSRSLGVSPQYRKFFDPIGYPTYQPGATFTFLPEHTWAMGLTYARVATTVALNITGSGPLLTQQDAVWRKYLDFNIRLQENLARCCNNNAYVSVNPGYAMADLTAIHRLSGNVDGVIHIDNLTDRYANDFFGRYATIGRQMNIGLKIRAQ